MVLRKGFPNSGSFKKGQTSLRKGKKHSEETRKKMSESSNHYVPKSAFKKGHISPNKGKKLSKEVRKRMSESHKGLKANNYIDGKSKLVNMIRTMREYLKWRADVFKRDNYHCQSCGEKGYLEAHHIIPFIKILREFDVKNFEGARKCKLLWDVGNGISYCKTCHPKFDVNRGRKLSSQTTKLKK